jgi:hypothetical protein
VKSSLILAVLFVAVAVPATGQTTLTITANTLSAFSLTSDPTSSQTLNITTTVGGFFLFIPQVGVCAYMSQSMQGTGGNSGIIGNTSVQLNNTSIVTGATNCGVATAASVASHASGFCFCGSKTYNDTATVRIASYSATLPADTYTGTINLVATAQ